MILRIKGQSDRCIVGNLTWDKSYHNVWRTVKIIEEIASQVRIDGALDIITGFGVMNEPGPYVPVELLKNFYNDAYIAIRRSMPDAYIYVGDGFNSANFNSFWTGTKQTEHPKKNSIYYVTDGYYANTPNEGWVDDVRDVVLDTHIYQCFTLSMRMMTPREHIEEVSHSVTQSLSHSVEFRFFGFLFVRSLLIGFLYYSSTDFLSFS